MVAQQTKSSAENREQDLALTYLRRIMMAPVYDIARETDLTYLPKISAQLNNQVFLKREDQQPVHSFKLRGAYNKLQQLSSEQRSNGVIAASAGNHAQGLALAAKSLGVKATIVMPITTPEIKVNNVRHFGAEVRLIGKSFNEAQQAAIEFVENEQKTFIPPFDDPDVIVGQGTVGKEILQQLADVDAIFVPCGGGGLLAGIAVYVKQIAPHVKVIGVEAEDSACLKAAFDAGTPVDLDNVGLFADGVAVKRIGEHTFDLIYKYCDEVITVSSDEICAAIKETFEQTRVIAEPAGALSLAGINKYVKTSKGNEKLVAILSGANMNFHSLRYVSERCELGEQKEAVFSVTIPEQKGSFRQFCQTLGGRAITEFNYRYSDANKANIFVGIRLSHGAQERQELVNILESSGYQVQDLTDNELAKLHVRYMIGGASKPMVKERLFRFEFPEYPGALEKFLNTLGELWNITLFHYRNHGAAFGQVLAGFEVADSEQQDFFAHLQDLGYEWFEETDNPAYQAFLSQKGE